MDENKDREVAIQISGVKKMYKLGQIGGGTLQADLQSWWARKRGKEDPNTIIGQEQRLVGKTFMALNGIDLTIYKGEAVGIIGGNGAGKSTLLKLLSQVTAPTEGKIELWGRIASMLEVGTGFNGEMTGRENVYMNGAILGMTKAEIDAKMEQIIEFSEVRDFIDTPVKRYSSGMYVKLAFSVAAHLDSEIMIMDEVLAVGDMAFQKKCLDKMRDAAKQEGRTVIYVSHNMNTIRQLCDRCIVLDKGKVIFNGNSEDAIARYLHLAASELNVDYNFKNYVSGNPAHRKMVAIDSLRILDKDKAIFSNQESLKLILTWRELNKVEKVKIIMSMKNSYAERIGATETHYLTNVHQGRNETVISFDLSCLTSGTYDMYFSVVGVDCNNNAIELDQTHNIPIQIMDIKPDCVNWQRQWWGSIRLPELLLLNQ